MLWTFLAWLGIGLALWTLYDLWRLRVPVNRLVWWAIFGKISRARRLLEGGVSPNEMGFYRLSPMGAAVTVGNWEMVDLFLEFGGDPNVVVWSRDSTRPALHTAATEGQLDLMQKLLQRGADPRASFMGQGAIHGAAYAGQAQAVELLLNAGLDLEYRDKLGFTALHHAALSGKRGVAELLIARGANPLARDENGVTPSELALASKHQELALYLKSREQQFLRDAF